MSVWVYIERLAEYIFSPPTPQGQITDKDVSNLENQDLLDEDDEIENEEAAELNDKDLLIDEDLSEAERNDKAQWMDDDDPEMGTRFSRLKNRCLAVMIKGQEGGLKSFTWRLGTCIPASLLGYNGYLPSKQKRLEALTLFTDGGCWNCFDDLGRFPNLKAFSWTGLREAEDCESLRGCFQVTSHQLERIELDFLTWQHVCEANPLANDEDVNYFSREILRLPSDDLTLVFPAIKYLALSGLSFTSAERQMASAFNFNSLHSLKLRFCPGWEMFLKQVASLSQPIQLKSLEIQSNTQYNDEDDEAATNLGVFGYD